MIRIAISGACGRMGERIFSLALKEKCFRVTGLIESHSHPMIGKKLEGGYEITDDIAAVADGTDVFIEFSSAEATIRHLEIMEKKRKKVVIGTTGFSKARLERIKRASKKIPVLMSPNMSMGVNLLFRLAEESAKKLGNYDVEIVEVHHNQKKDAPSGTARKLAEIIAGAKNIDLKKSAVYGREGMTGPRKPGEIGIMSVRSGDVVGEHTVIFAGTGERLELAHKAQSRDPLASGALAAAKWLSGKKPGLYDMMDVLGL